MNVGTHKTERLRRLNNSLPNDASFAAKHEEVPSLGNKDKVRFSLRPRGKARHVLQYDHDVLGFTAETQAAVGSAHHSGSPGPFPAHVRGPV